MLRNGKARKKRTLRLKSQNILEILGRRTVWSQRERRQTGREEGGIRLLKSLECHTKNVNVQQSGKRLGSGRFLRAIGGPQAGVISFPKNI